MGYCGDMKTNDIVNNNTNFTASVQVAFRLSNATEDVAEYATLAEALSARRDGEKITVVGYRDGESSPSWTADETAATTSWVAADEAAEAPWWKAPLTDEIECHTPRGWEAIARAARKAGDFRRATEADEAADRASR